MEKSLLMHSQYTIRLGDDSGTKKLSGITRNIESVLSLYKSQNTQYQEMGWIKYVEKPFGKIPVPLCPFSIVKVYDAKTGYKDSCYRTYRMDQVFPY